MRTLPDNSLWAGLRSIGLVARRCTVGDTESVDRRYFTDSIPARVEDRRHRCV